MFPDESTLKEDDKLTSFYTGLPNFAILLFVFTFVTKDTAESSTSKLTNFQSIVLILMKLRLHLSNYDLGFRFGIHETMISRILTNWVQLMDIRVLFSLAIARVSPFTYAMVLFCALWPKSHINNRLLRFSMRSQLTPCQRLLTYKNRNTVKYLINITPQGTVSLIAKGYSERASDRHITENSGYLNYLLPGDVILADRGINVAKSVAMKVTTLNIPAFTLGKPQLPAADIESTHRLPNVRILVERARVIGAVRQRYAILSTTTFAD